MTPAQDWIGFCPIPVGPPKIHCLCAGTFAQGNFHHRCQLRGYSAVRGLPVVAAMHAPLPRRVKSVGLTMSTACLLLPQLRTYRALRRLNREQAEEFLALGIRQTCEPLAC
jgi:hypothetical protein